MPCAVAARGKTDLKLPFKPGSQHDPCGLPICSTVGGVSVAAQNLCLWHYGLKWGQAAVLAPIVQAP